MVGIGNRNLLYGEKLTIVLSVSSTLPKDGFKPALRERAFFCLFLRAKEKTRDRCRCGFPLSLSPTQGLDFCERIMALNLVLVYMQRNIIQ
jgi:hypothetical protein